MWLGKDSNPEEGVFFNGTGSLECNTETVGAVCGSYCSGGVISPTAVSIHCIDPLIQYTSTVPRYTVVYGCTEHHAGKTQHIRA